MNDNILIVYIDTIIKQFCSLCFIRKRMVAGSICTISINLYTHWMTSPFKMVGNREERAKSIGFTGLCWECMTSTYIVLSNDCELPLLLTDWTFKDNIFLILDEKSSLKLTFNELNHKVLAVGTQPLAWYNLLLKRNTWSLLKLSWADYSGSFIN